MCGIKICISGTYNSYGTKIWDGNRWTNMIVRFPYILHEVVLY